MDKDHDKEAAKILFMFEGIRFLQSSQGIDSFDILKNETTDIIDEILDFDYVGENENLKIGFRSVKFWENGLKLIREKILDLEIDS